MIHVLIIDLNYNKTLLMKFYLYYCSYTLIGPDQWSVVGSRFLGRPVGWVGSSDWGQVRNLMGQV